ncbi:MAG TPA: FmdB family zinc ribbon protein [Acidimicrobiales bacterium]|nr:FmdB family zinc ribbon protein [Acidimicrobiales bacterium]
MPTYEYACKSCGEHLEVVQSFKDDPLTTCPACGGLLRKVFGSIGISFKGSGFYKTDSRQSAKPAETKKAAESAKSESAKSESAKSEPKSGSPSSGSATSSTAAAS